MFPFASSSDINIASTVDYNDVVHEDFADIGLCDEECDDEVSKYDQGGAGTSHDHRNNTTLQQPTEAATPSCQPTEAVSGSNFDTVFSSSSSPLQKYGSWLPYKISLCQAS